MNRTETPRTPLLGGPTSRRELFRIGGLTLAAGALVAACGGEADDVARTGGTLAEEANAYDPTQPPATLVRTLSSIEQLLVATYGTILSEGWLDEPELTEAFELFVTHHEEHVTQLAALAREVGADPYDEPNAYLQATVVDPAVLAIEEALAEEEAEVARTAVLDLAYGLENLALQTYVRSTPMFEDAAQRQQAMALGAVSGRHIAVILTAEGQPLPFSIVPVGAAVPDDARIDESGPVATPPTTAAPAEAEE